MTVSVSYHSSFGTTTVVDYLNTWSSQFGSAEHGKVNTGSFNQSRASGDQYATASSSKDAFIAGSDTSNGLNYVFKFNLPSGDNLNHYLWGSLDSIEMGSDLAGGKGQNFTLQDSEVNFNGLDLCAALGAGRAGNEVQEVIHGLMQGKPQALEAELNDFGLSTASTFDQLAAAGLATAAPAALVDVGLVGVQDVVPDLLMAA